MLLTVSLLFLLFLATNVQAAEGVTLNEIYAPSSADWVELYNSSTSSVDVSDWKLQDTTSTPVKIFPSGTSINPLGFLAVDVSNRLNNSGDVVKLYDNNNSEIDRFEYTSTQEGKSFKRLPNGSGQWYQTSGLSKGASNGTDPPPDESVTKTGKITLSEFMPNPDGGSEWVEVYNPNNFELDITNWKIDDIDGGSAPFTIPGGTKIKANGYKVFSFSSKLNNSGDSLRLLNPNGSIVEKYDFDSTERGRSFAKDIKGTWKLTTTPTPGSANKITSAQPENSPAVLTGSDAQKRFSTDLAGNKSNSTAFSDQTIGNYTGGNDQEGKIAGISKSINENSKFSTLLIAAGFSFILVALIWPFLEKYLWTTKK